jgi:hypothetical protein
VSTKEIAVLLRAGKYIAVALRCRALDSAHPSRKSSMPRRTLLQKSKFQIVADHEPGLAGRRSGHRRAPGHIGKNDIGRAQRLLQAPRHDATPHQLVLPHAREIKAPNAGLQHTVAQLEIGFLGQIRLNGIDAQTPAKDAAD